MLGERLSQLIQTLGVSKKEFSNLIGFSQAYVSMILGGKRPNPSVRFIDSIVRQFQVNGEWLKSGTGEMFAQPTANLASSDLDLLRKYHLLPLSERKIVDEIVDAMLMKKNSKNNPS